ncbi:MAG: glycosyltransferase family 4 protein [Cyanobacteria bacterium J06621_8]
MKALLISTSDSQSGASRAAFQLHQGLKSVDVKSQMLVQTKRVDDEAIIGSRASSGIGQVISGSRLTLNQVPLKLYPKSKSGVYSLQWLPDNIANKVARLNPNIINLHWVCNNYLQIETLSKLNKPLVWTLHDMWAFTGGCHYDQECNRYTEFCGACPKLDSKRNWDLSRWVLQRKAKAWKDLNLTIVTPSIWLAKCAQESSLFKNKRVEVIPNALNLNTYRPINQRVARELLKLPQDKKLILFLSLRATSDQRKGFHLLQPALRKLSRAGWKEKVELVVVGASRPEKPPELGFKPHYLGTLRDDMTLALAYSAADAFIAPSVQDNLPNTVLEAISCGTPCIAFSIGGMPDMIEHKKNGYLAEPFSIEDFAEGVSWVLENEERHQILSFRAREKAEQEFTLGIQAHRYASLFNELLK